MPEIELKAKTAKAARTEIASRFPQGANYRGYDKDRDVVLMSLVRPRGHTANVATVRRSRGSAAIRFTCVPLS